MKKLLLLLFFAFMTSCVPQKLFTYNGCKYETSIGIFTDTIQVDIVSSDFTDVDVARVVLATVIDNKDVSPLSIRLPKSLNGKTQYALPLESAEYIKDNCSKIYLGDTDIEKKKEEVFKLLK